LRAHRPLNPGPISGRRGDRGELPFADVTCQPCIGLGEWPDRPDATAPDLNWPTRWGGGAGGRSPPQIEGRCHYVPSWQVGELGTRECRSVKPRNWIINMHVRWMHEVDGRGKDEQRRHPPRGPLAGLGPLRREPTKKYCDGVNRIRKSN
jgi:hypothetical protein